MLTRWAATDDDTSTFVPSRRRPRRTWWVALAILLAATATLGTGVTTYRQIHAAPPLTPLQQVVRQYILDRCDEPETVQWEKWWPEVPEPSGWGYQTMFWTYSIPADHVVRVRYRTRGILGTGRGHDLYYLDRGKVSGFKRQSFDNYFDEIVEHYYPTDPTRESVEDRVARANANLIQPFLDPTIKPIPRLNGGVRP